MNQMIRIRRRKKKENNKITEYPTVEWLWSGNRWVDLTKEKNLNSSILDELE